MGSVTARGAAAAAPVAAPVAAPRRGSGHPLTPGACAQRVGTVAWLHAWIAQQPRQECERWVKRATYLSPRSTSGTVRRAASGGGACVDTLCASSAGDGNGGALRQRYAYVLLVRGFGRALKLDVVRHHQPVYVSESAGL